MAAQHTRQRSSAHRAGGSGHLARDGQAEGGHGVVRLVPQRVVGALHDALQRRGEGTAAALRDCGEPWLPRPIWAVLCFAKRRPTAFSLAVVLSVAHPPGVGRPLGPRRRPKLRLARTRPTPPGQLSGSAADTPCAAPGPAARSPGTHLWVQAVDARPARVLRLKGAKGAVPHDQHARKVPAGRGGGAP